MIYMYMYDWIRFNLLCFDFFCFESSSRSLKCVLDFFYSKSSIFFYFLLHLTRNVRRFTSLQVNRIRRFQFNKPSVLSLVMLHLQIQTSCNTSNFINLQHVHVLSVSFLNITCLCLGSPQRRANGYNALITSL